MRVGLDNRKLAHLSHKLKKRIYDEVDQMHAWIAIEELIELRFVLNVLRKYDKLTAADGWYADMVADALAKFKEEE